MSARPNSPYSWAIEERGDYQYRVRFRRKGYPKGSRTFESLATAEDYIRRVESEMFASPDNFERAHQKRHEARKTDFGFLLSRYQEEVTPSHKGSDAEHHRINTILRHHIADKAISALAPSDFASYRDQRLLEVSSGSVKREMGIMSRVISHAQNEWGWRDAIPTHPMEGISRPQENPPRTRRLIGDEEEKLLAACKAQKFVRNQKSAEHRKEHPYIYTLVHLAIETAARQGELRKVRWEDVDFDKRTMHLTETKDPKRRYKARTVALTKPAAEVLCAWHKLHDQPATGPVFPGVTAQAIKKAFSNACASAEIRDLHFHDLRHEGTSRLHERYGFSMMEVMTITGHSSTEMQERYTHLFAHELSEKMQKVEAIDGSHITIQLSEQLHNLLRVEALNREITPEDTVVELLHEKLS
jgi:integrase